MGRTTCSNDAPCALHARWSTARDAYFQFLKETTVADLATQFVPNSRPIEDE
jgi:DNA-binding IscR family transcriptional regulator